MKIDTFPRFFSGFWQHEKLPPFGKFRWPAEIFLRRCYASTSCGIPPWVQRPKRLLLLHLRRIQCAPCQRSSIRALLPLASHAAVSNSSICKNIAKGKSCYNTICDRRFFDVNRHSAKSRPSLRMERALRSGRWDSFSAASNH